MGKKPKELPEIPTRDDVKQLLAYFNQKTKTGFRNYVLTYTLVKTGMRSKECINLRWNNIKETESITGETVYYYHLTAKKSKNRKAAHIPIPKEVYKLFLELSRMYGQRQHGYVFTSVSKRGEDGLRTPVDSGYLRRIYGEISKKLELSVHVSPHKLRHHYASLIYAKTNNILLVQKALRHSSLSMSQIYTHLNPEDVREASDLIDY